MTNLIIFLFPIRKKSQRFEFKGYKLNAVTKNWQSYDNLYRMTCRALKSRIQDFDVKELSGGFFSAVYLIEADERKVILKIGPNRDVRIMRHELEYIPTEAEMLHKLRNIDILIPKLITFDDSGEICNEPYFFMSFIEGTPLSETEVTGYELDAIKYQVGRITRQICSNPAPYFAVPGLPASITTRNSRFVLTLVKWLLDDAAEKQISIPFIKPTELLNYIDSYSHALDEAIPCYAHTDTWDGNLLIKDGKLNGLIDFAAILYADPLMSHDFHDFNAKPLDSFLRGYGKTSFTENEMIRIQIYRIWQRLGMIVERGYRCYDDSNIYAWVLDKFVKEVKKMEAFGHINRLL